MHCSDPTTTELRELRGSQVGMGLSERCAVRRLYGVITSVRPTGALLVLLTPNGREWEIPCDEVEWVAYTPRPVVKEEKV